MKKFLKIISQIISKTIIVFLIITLIYILYSKYIAKDKITKIGGYGFLVVVSGSMEPEIETNELVIIKEDNLYSIGDIITYESDDYLVTHRIIEIEGTSIITKGDSNNVEDKNIDVNQIEGKVVYHSKALGIFVIYYLKIVLIAFVILVFLIFARKGGDKSGEQKNSGKQPRQSKREEQTSKE